ncbi:MAG: squalene/phytoene synthase family protein, partial [Pseudomonadota bacterium]
MSAEPPRLTPFGEIARSGDPDRFAAALFARDETTRERLFTLIAFNLEIARIPWLVSEPQLGAIRLAWWRERLAAGDGGGGADADAARAPLAAALHELMAETGLDPELLGAMIDAREADLAEDAPPDRDAVDAYVTGTAARLLQAAAWVAAAPETPPETRHEIDLTARDAGWAQGAAALLRAAPELAARGRCVLPLAPADRAALAAGDTTPAARRAAGAIAEAALARLAAARAR